MKVPWKYQLIYIAYWKFTDQCYTLGSPGYTTLFGLCDLQDMKDFSVNSSLSFIELVGLQSRDELCPVQFERGPWKLHLTVSNIPDLCLGKKKKNPSPFTVLCPLSLLKVYESIFCGVLWVLATAWPYVIAAVYILIHYNRAQKTSGFCGF